MSSLLLINSPDSPSPPNTDPSSQTLCGFCGRSFSRYTCPSCNAGYCTLTCYRSEAHSQCTESFYRKAVEDQIRSEPSQSAEEKRKMMEMLKRLEEDSLDVTAEDNSDDGDDGGQDSPDASLEARLAGLNIDSLDSDAMWSLLNKEEKATFMKAIQDPSSEKAQEVLAAHDIEIQSFAPWWEAGSTIIEKEQRASRPQMMVIPSGPSSSQGQSFLFNIFAITLAYAFATRRIVTSPLSSIEPDNPDAVAAREDIGTTAPFLVDRRSTILFTETEEVITEVWSRMDTVFSKSLLQLLRDSLCLLRVPAVTSTSDSDSDVSPVLLMLSDIHALFTTWLPSQSSVIDNLPSKQPKPNHIALKVAFYASKAASIPLESYRTLTAAIELKIEELAADLGHDERQDVRVGKGLILGDVAQAQNRIRSGPLIEEIS